MPLGLKIVFVTLAGLVLISGAAIVTLFIAFDRADHAVDEPVWTESPRPRITTPGPGPTASSRTPTRPPTTRPPTSRPPTSRPPTSEPPRRPAHLEPQRGYDPVQLPDRPRTEAEAIDAARSAELYREKVSKSKCAKMVDLSGHPYGNVSEKKMRSRMQVMADCAAAMWKKPLAKSGFQATKVKIRIYTGSGKSPCGTTPFGTASAFYCSANQQIYMEKGLGASRNQSYYTWGNYLMVMDHEFGPWDR